MSVQPITDAGSGFSAATVRRVLADRPTYVIFALVTLFFVAFAPNFATLDTAEAILRVTALVSG